MHVLNTHARDVRAPRASVMAEIEALGSDADRIWPAPRYRFVRTPGPLRVGATHERHGLIRATLDRHEPGAVVWRSTLSYITGTHGFSVTALAPDRCRVEHVLDADLSWWFTPVWRLKMGAIHDRVVERLLDRLEACFAPMSA